MSDIVERLRGWVYTGPLYSTAQEAADEIEKLRHRVRFADAVIRSGNVATLTDEEREAVQWGIACMQNAGLNADGLRELLERLG